MKNTFKMLLKWLGTFVLCFAVIYVIVFVGGWRLFESGDIVLIEVGAALVISVFVAAISEVISSLEKRIKALEEQLNNAEDKQ